jgi:hypothetical protein
MKGVLRNATIKPCKRALASQKIHYSRADNPEPLFSFEMNRNTASDGHGH